MHYFVTGTDTDSGKTFVSCLLLQALKRAGRNVTGFKPFVCGGREDAILLANAGSPGVTLDQINPVWLKVPAAPFSAALMENRRFELNEVIGCFEDLASRFDNVLIEGAGGWEVPLTEFATMADFAQRLGMPVIVVVNNRLGCLNHALLTVRNIQARGMTCAGLILNYVMDERDAASISNRMVLEKFLPDIPILAEIMHGETEIEWPLE